MTIIVRGIALDEVNRENGVRIFLKEFAVGILTGIVIGAIVAAVEAIVQGNPYLGLVTGLAMVPQYDGGNCYRLSGSGDP